MMVRPLIKHFYDHVLSLLTAEGVNGLEEGVLFHGMVYKLFGNGDPENGIIDIFDSTGENVIGTLTEKDVVTFEKGHIKKIQKGYDASQVV